MGMPALLIRDLELIREILVTSFNSFNMNEFAIDAEVILSKNFIFLKSSYFMKNSA